MLKLLTLLWTSLQSKIIEFSSRDHDIGSEAQKPQWKYLRADPRSRFLIMPTSPHFSKAFKWVSFTRISHPIVKKWNWSPKSEHLWESFWRTYSQSSTRFASQHLLLLRIYICNPVMDSRNASSKILYAIFVGLLHLTFSLQTELTNLPCFQTMLCGMKHRFWIDYSDHLFKMAFEKTNCPTPSSYSWHQFVA